jgi:CheY-like chemotaxis protein
MAETELAAHESAAEAGGVLVSPTRLQKAWDRPHRTTIQISEALARLFQDNGFQTRTADSRQEVIQAARASRPDLIILDVSMPGRCGVSVYRDLKEDVELEGIPLVLLTAIGDPFSRFTETGARLSGAVGFVARPLDVDLLWEAVQEALRAPVR